MNNIVQNVPIHQVKTQYSPILYILKYSLSLDSIYIGKKL